MKIAISGTGSREDGASLYQMKKTLDSLNIDTRLMQDTNHKLAKEVDLVLITGGDRGILDYFHKVVTDSAPVLGVYESYSTGFLAQLEVKRLRISNSKFKEKQL